MTLQRLRTARNQLEAARARTDERAWVVNRRARTRRLIELGGLVVKAGVVDLANDDRAAIHGALLNVAGLLKDDQAAERLQLWRRRGRRAFEAEADPKASEARSERPE